MASAVHTHSLIDKVSLDDFSFLKQIGEGAFGSVFLVKNVHNNQECALKVMDRHKRRNQMEYIDAEVEALHILSECTNFFVPTYGITYDDDLVYFALGFARNGDLFQYIFRECYFNLDVARYYAAELLMGLELLHSKGIIHRDLKPENILLDENWHIRITDFGLAKVLGKKDNETTMDDEPAKKIGTPEYMSPEVFDYFEATFASDLWAFGCIVYEMLSGQALFDRNRGLTLFEMIEELDNNFTKSFDASAKDLVKKLIVVDPEQRLGALDSKPYRSIRDHNFFCGINWDDLGEPPKNYKPNDENFLEREVVTNTNSEKEEQNEEVNLSTEEKKN